MHIILYLFLIFILTKPCYTQWSQVAPNLLGSVQQNCCGFGSISFRSATTWAGLNRLYSSNDSGLTWQLISTYPGGKITDINFFDDNVGLVAAVDGLYLTLDRANTWQRISAVRDCYGATFAGSPDNIVAAFDPSGFFYSTDQGNSWNRQSKDAHPHYAVGRPDGSAYAFTGSDQTGFGALYRTTNRGMDWARGGTIDYDSWSVAFDSCVNNIYLMTEDGHISNDSYGQIYVSTDYGTSWQLSEEQRLGWYNGSLATSNCVVYYQTLQNGVRRSIDRGNSWQSIGGPSNNIDVRMLCPITDNLILAADNNGSIWRTTNSGGDSVVIDLTPISANLSSERVINDTLGSTVLLPIVLRRNGQPTVDMEMVIHYEVNGALVYVESLSRFGRKLDIPGEAWDGRAKIRILASDLPPLQDSIIGYVKFLFFPYEPYCEAVVFDSLRFGAADRCSRGVDANDSTYSYVGSYETCGLNSVAPHSNPPKSVHGLALKPNPAKESITLTSQKDIGKADLSISSIDGKLLWEGSETIYLGGRVIIPLIGLSDGLYYLHIKSSNVSTALPFIHRK